MHTRAHASRHRSFASLQASLLSLVAFLALACSHGDATLVRSLRMRGSAQSTAGIALTGESEEEVTQAAEPPAPPRGDGDREEAKEADESSSDDGFLSSSSDDGFLSSSRIPTSSQPAADGAKTIPDRLAALEVALLGEAQTTAVIPRLETCEQHLDKKSAGHPLARICVLEEEVFGQSGKNAVPEPHDEQDGEEKIRANVLFLGGENLVLEFPRNPSPTIGDLRSKVRGALSEEHGQFRDIRLFAPPSESGTGSATGQKHADVGTGEAIGDDDLEIEFFFEEEEPIVFFALLGASWWGRHFDSVSSKDMRSLKSSVAAIASRPQFQRRVIYARDGEYEQHLMFAAMLDEQVHRALLGYADGTADEQVHLSAVCGALGRYWNMRGGSLIEVVSDEISKEVARELTGRGFVDFAKVSNKREIKDHVRVEDVVTVLNSDKVRAIIDDKIEYRNGLPGQVITLTRALLPNETHMELNPKFVRQVVSELHELAGSWKRQQETREIAAAFLENEAISGALEPIFVAEDGEPVPKLHWFALLQDEQVGCFSWVGLQLFRFQGRLEEPETPEAVAQQVRNWWETHGVYAYARLARRGEAALAKLEEIGRE